MARRKTVMPVPEPAIFTDEMHVPTKVVIQSEEAFFRGVRKRVAEFANGRRVQPVATVSFESVGALLAVLTPKRYEIIETVKAHGRFESIEALATTLGRDRAAVSRDLKALSQAGLLRARDAVAPGHGRRTEIDSAARELRIEIRL